MIIRGIERTQRRALGFKYFVERCDNMPQANSVQERLCTSMMRPLCEDVAARQGELVALQFTIQASVSKYTVALRMIVVPCELKRKMTATITPPPPPFP